MKDEISKRSSGRIYEKLVEFWYNDTAREEKKSNRILETNNIWLKNNEEKYGQEPVKDKPKTQKQTENLRTCDVFKYFFPINIIFASSQCFVSVGRLERQTCSAQGLIDPGIFLFIQK